MTDDDKNAWAGMETTSEMQITLKGFLLTMFILWSIFFSAVCMVLICKAIF